VCLLEDLAADSIGLHRAGRERAGRSPIGRGRAGGRRTYWSTGYAHSLKDRSAARCLATAIGCRPQRASSRSRLRCSLSRSASDQPAVSASRGPREHGAERPRGRSLAETARWPLTVPPRWSLSLPECRLSLISGAPPRRPGSPGRPRSGARPGRASSNGSLRRGRLVGSGTLLPWSSSRRRPLGCWRHECSRSC